MDAQITVLPTSPELEKARKHQKEFYSTCERIRTAWDRMGYSGDPIISLFSAILGMSVYDP